MKIRLPVLTCAAAATLTLAVPYAVTHVREASIPVPGSKPVFETEQKLAAIETQAGFAAPVPDTKPDVTPVAFTTPEESATTAEEPVIIEESVQLKKFIDETNTKTSGESSGSHTPEFEVSRLGDVNKNCGALATEAQAMQIIINSAEQVQQESEMKDHGITAAGAVGSLLIGTVTGGIGLAAAGFMASEAVEAQNDNAENITDLAAQRQSFMIGIHKAKGCAGQIKLPEPEPKSASLNTPPIPRSAPPKFND